MDARPSIAHMFGKPDPAGVEALGGGRALALDDPDRAWLVESGSVDVFAVIEGEDGAAGVREFLFEARKGTLLLGMGEAAGEVGIRLIAVGWEDSRVQAIDTSGLGEGGLAKESARWIAPALDPWLEGLSRGVTKHIARRAHPQTWISPSEEVSVDEDERATSRKGVVWGHLLEGKARYIDIEELDSADGVVLVPLTSDSWLEERGGLKVKGYSTGSFLMGKGWRGRVGRFHAMVLRCLRYDFRNMAANERKRLEKLAAQIEDDKHKTLTRFASLLDEKGFQNLDLEGEDATYRAAQLVGQRLGIEIKAPPGSNRKREGDKPLSVEQVARASRVRTRQVALRGAWWTEDNGPLVAFRSDGGKAVALLQKGAARYELHDPETGDVTPVNRKVADTLAPMAATFYPPFPNRKLGAWDLIKFGIGGSKKDLAAILITGALGGLLGMAVPIATAMIFDAVIPGHEKNQLHQIGLGLVVAALATMAFNITGQIAMLRIEGRVAGQLQAAVLDRLLRLPNSFFAEHSAGDLAVRTMMVEQVRKVLTGVALSAVMAGVFSMFSFALLFIYAPMAAVVATGLFLLLSIATVITGMKQLKAILEGEALSGSIFSMVLQIVTGIQKLRLAGAEDRAFNRWGKTFGEMRARLVRSRKVNNLYMVFVSGYEVLSMAAIFAAVALMQDEDMSTGVFLAFVAAFSTFLSSTLQISRAVIQVFTTQPMYGRSKPILETLPEVDDSKEDPGQLTGAFEINRVTFAYTKDGPKILNGLSFAVREGEFIALVGPSGCGKSTLMKLLLGFEKPRAGGVYYDGQDLKNLDLTAVRRQIGVVLQSGKLMPGTIYENIKGATECTVDEAWEAAALSGIEADIKAMPMGMHTVLTEGSAALSGGQVQRLLIARALIAKPRILFFDEATSALDNRTQAVITESLDRLSVTRIVIAHRLSTVRNADKIYVLSGGKVAESGNYDELMEQDGIFADLARRQLT